MPYNQPIQRRLVAAVTKEYEQRGQVAPQQATQEQTPVMLPTVFFGYNLSSYGSGAINPGSRVLVWNFHPYTLSYANAVKQIFRNKIKLEVDPASSQWSNTDQYKKDDFIALTPARPNRICQFYSQSNSFYFAHVNAPAPAGYDGRKIDAYYRYVDINGVATNDEENAYAEIRFGTPIVNNYAVAFCRRLVKEGLTLEEVDDEIDTKVDGAFVRSKLNTTSGTFVTNVSFSTDNRYLYINNARSSAITSVLANNQ